MYPIYISAGPIRSTEWTPVFFERLFLESMPALNQNSLGGSTAWPNRNLTFAVTKLNGPNCFWFVRYIAVCVHSFLYKRVFMLGFCNNKNFYSANFRIPKVFICPLKIYFQQYSGSILNIRLWFWIFYWGLSQAWPANVRCPMSNGHRAFNLPEFLI